MRSPDTDFECVYGNIGKHQENRLRNLVKLGISNQEMRQERHGHTDMRRVCRNESICFAMSNARLSKFGLLSAEEYFMKVSS